ncbi:MAG: metallophosphoesterase family protein [Myxococcales bacterium]|jgi:predicted phosphodiesterase
MVRARALTAGVLLLASACLDPTAERTTRDFEEIGRADLGEIQAHIEPGVAESIDREALRVRFRANAPQVRLTFDSTASAEQKVVVELANVFEDVETDPPLAVRRLGQKRIAFDVLVPAGGQRQVTVARPKATGARPFRFAWVGDVQGGLDRFARVRERINADPAIEFVLFAGDDTSRGQPDEIQDFLAAAEALNAPWYTVIGNHEAMGDVAFFQRTLGRINVAFDYRGARFVLVDSASGTIDERVHQRMAEWLGEEGPRLRIAAMHMPPFDYEGLRDGGFNSRTEGAKVMSRLSSGGTDLLLNGHLHTLRFSSMADVPTVVSGCGGVDFGMRLDGSDLHYLAIDADPGREELTIGLVEVR